jgi:hypothetical protein
MSVKRLLATETLDPNGSLPRWITPGVRRLGWEAWTLPTHEAVQMLGPSVYASMVVQIVEQLRPHVLLVCPPYDYLSPDSCRQIRALGTRIIGLTFDDPLFEKIWGKAAWTDLRERFDLWATTTVNGPTIEAGAKPVLWVMAPESVEIDDPAAPAHEAVLIGRCTPEREAVAQAVASAGVHIACYGPGWANGPVTRPSMLGLMRRAKVVITPCNGTNAVKGAMVEAALVGSRQIIEYSHSLEQYILSQKRPATYRTPKECVERLLSDKPLPEWSDVPSWDTEWPKLIADMMLAEQPERSRSTALEQLYASLAHTYERHNYTLAAMGCLNTWANAAPNDWGPKFALARCARNSGQWAKAIELTREIEQALEEHIPAAATNLRSFIPEGVQGKGLGNSGAVDSRLEIVAIRLHSLLMDNQLDVALEEVDAMSGACRAAVRATMIFDHDIPDAAELAKALVNSTIADSEGADLHS